MGQGRTLAPGPHTAEKVNEEGTWGPEAPCAFLINLGPRRGKGDTEGPTVWEADLTH